MISLSKGISAARTFFAEAMQQRDELGVTAITLAEFYAGLSPPQLGTWDAFIAPLEYWPLTREAARQAGRWRYEFDAIAHMRCFGSSSRNDSVM